MFGHVAEGDAGGPGIADAFGDFEALQGGFDAEAGPKSGCGGIAVGLGLQAHLRLGAAEVDEAASTFHIVAGEGGEFDGVIEEGEGFGGLLDEPVDDAGGIHRAGLGAGIAGGFGEFEGGEGFVQSGFGIRGGDEDPGVQRARAGLRDVIAKGAEFLRGEARLVQGFVEVAEMEAAFAG